MTYVVNGDELSTKKAATEAIFAALEDGEVTVSKVAAEDKEDAPVKDTSPVAGPPVVL